MTTGTARESDITSGFPAADPEPAARILAEWALAIRAGDVPDDVIAATQRRILDVIGLAFAGAETPFGRAVRSAARALSPPGPARLVGSPEGLGAPVAAFANAACAQALEFDDTHDESIVHMSSPSVMASLALAETATVDGRALLAAVAVGNEVSCRVGSAAPGQFHRRGFHPTGLFAPFGVTCAAGRLLGLEADTLARALGVCGSFASGLLECWVDGTQSKFLHSGWAAQGGLTAALLAKAGVTGPPRILEGRFGFFASHLQDAAAPLDLARMTAGLGTLWESRRASFKPYPAAHVLHPYLDALLRARQAYGFTAADVERIDCPVAAYIVPIVCEPVDEKCRPATDAHGRVSLQYTLAEAVWHGRLGKDAYRDYRDPGIRALARRVHYAVDPDYPGPGRFMGAVRITLGDGRVIEETQPHNRGSAENPMTDEELRAKFDENVGDALVADRRERLAAAIAGAASLRDVRVLMDLAAGGEAALRG
jgi:2-methylcitrate dehydratase PrpD